MVGYYGKFIPFMATLSEPLNELRRTQIKRMLVLNELLVHYDPEKPLFLATDASDYGVGAVLFHKDAESGKMGVIGYALRTLNPAERKYVKLVGQSSLELKTAVACWDVGSAAGAPELPRRHLGPFLRARILKASKSSAYFC
uniref:RT_RNaseH_2 domain-containing protein n=1 Tax=Globodera pallida TaxID=36090 RepID=A0A183BXH8_GLOPA